MDNDLRAEVDRARELATRLIRDWPVEGWVRSRATFAGPSGRCETEYAPVNRDGPCRRVLAVWTGAAGAPVLLALSVEDWHGNTLSADLAE